MDTKELLSGAEFTVKDGAGNLIGKEKQYVTGVDGTVTLTGLTPDTTVVASEETPPVGYWNGSDLQTTVLKSGKANSVTFENRKLGTHFNCLISAQASWWSWRTRFSHESPR